MVEKFLILGGTKEAVNLAAKLVSDGHDVTTSLAGRTEHPDPIMGKIRTGGFGGVDGLVQYLSENNFTQLFDATHPFATQISSNAVQAANKSGIKFKILTRSPWEKEEGDNWVEVSSLEEARDIIPANTRVLLAMGSQHIAPFATRKDVFFLVRMIDQPNEPILLEKHELLIARPSDSVDEEAAILRGHKLSHIVCRNSGGDGAYAKIAAARVMGRTVIMISQPHEFADKNGG